MNVAVFGKGVFEYVIKMMSYCFREVLTMTSDLIGGKLGQMQNNQREPCDGKGGDWRDAAGN